MENQSGSKARDGQVTSVLLPSPQPVASVHSTPREVGDEVQLTPARRRKGTGEPTLVAAPERGSVKIKE